MQAKPNRRRISAPLYLLPCAFISLVLCFEVVTVIHASWHEDFEVRLIPSPEWKPNRVYSSEIEAALTALTHTDPIKVEYLRQRGIPIHILTRIQMARTGCPESSLGCTRSANASINVIDRAADTSKDLAVVLAHELTHCRFHDSIDPIPPRSFLQRLLWRNEEAEAHVAGISTARRIGLPYMTGPLSGWWFEYLVWFWPAATFLITGLASLFTLHRSVEYIKLQALRRAAEIRVGKQSSETIYSEVTPAIP